MTYHNENWQDLYCAIYKQAVNDDCKAVEYEILQILVKDGYNDKNILKYITTNKDFINNEIAKEVYKEAKGDVTVTKKDNIKNIVKISDQVAKGYGDYVQLKISHHMEKMAHLKEKRL